MATKGPPPTWHFTILKSFDKVSYLSREWVNFFKWGGTLHVTIVIFDVWKIIVKGSWIVLDKFSVQGRWRVSHPRVILEIYKRNSQEIKNGNFSLETAL